MEITYRKFLFQEFSVVPGWHHVAGLRASRHRTGDATALREVDVGRCADLEGDFPGREVDASHGRRHVPGVGTAAEVHG